MRRAFGTIITAWACTAAYAQTPEDALAQAVAALMLPASAQHSFYDWNHLDVARPVRWAPLAPTMLDDALPDGAYFTLTGVMNVGKGIINVTATGVRTMVMNVYFRNRGAAIGEAAVLAALTRSDLALELVRCPIKASTAAGAKWWSVKAPGKRPAWFHSQTVCDGAKCEGYSLLLGEALPSMTPQEQRLYTDRCAAGAPAVQPAAAAEWDEQLASLLAALIPPRGAAAADWKVLEEVTAVRWEALPPRATNQPPWHDGMRYYRAGQIDLGGRVLHVTATGTRTSVLNVYFEDQATQANRGDALRALWRKGYTVQLARCGKSYQLSTDTWYRVTGRDARPVMIRRGIRCDSRACPRAQESYALALAGTLLPLSDGEVDAVGNTCPGR